MGLNAIKLQDERNSYCQCAFAKSKSQSNSNQVKGISHRHQVKQHDALFWQGDNQSCLYAIYSGSLKTVMVDEDGLEQITDFYYKDDFLGLSSLIVGQYQSTAVALQNTLVCSIKLNQLASLCNDTPELYRQLMRLMSNELSKSQQFRHTLGCHNSSGRIAAFLIDLSRQRERQGLTASPVHLHMTQRELANFLWLRHETLNRVFRKLKNHKIIHISQTMIEILDFERLACWPFNNF